MASVNSGPHSDRDLPQMISEAPLDHPDFQKVAGQTSPDINLGLPQKIPGTLLDCLESQRVPGQIINASNLALEGAVGSSQKDPSIPISFPNIKPSSLHSNPTFEKHPVAKMELISNALDPKKHIVVTFQKKLDNKSKTKAHVNSLNTSKGHSAENRKENGLNGKSLFKSIRGRGGNSNQPGYASSKFVRVFREYNREHKLDLINLLETRVSGEKADLIFWRYLDWVEGFSLWGGAPKPSSICLSQILIVRKGNTFERFCKILFHLMGPHGLRLVTLMPYFHLMRKEEDVF
ncbi:putative protein isoform X2 [Gossypium australe]|uniref:Uncharacterized protein n=1 Tax=Gossypium australe TaxID=47621 RepID=A0A5B6X163_9ROSI|nr:putative protein isoform X2 [Gossypium australe]